MVPGCTVESEAGVVLTEDDTARDRSHSPVATKFKRTDLRRIVWSLLWWLNRADSWLFHLNRILAHGYYRAKNVKTYSTITA